jgi:polyisoprenoid-binding protein YceI
MMRIYISVACALIAMTASQVVAADSFTIDPEYTIPEFEVGHLGFTTQRGRFNKAEGKIQLDIAGRTGSVDFTVHTDSIDMGSHAWTVHVRSEGLFDVAHFPTISFRSERLIFEGDKVIGAEGQFTLLGVTRPLTLTVSGFGCASNPANNRFMCAGDVSATVKRSDFGMTKYIPTVSDEIRISVPVEAYRD